jgi:hypothetical protein
MNKNVDFMKESVLLRRKAKKKAEIEIILN